MNWKLHKKWTTKSGLEAAIVLASPTYPHYCGYVAVTEEHPACGMSYDEVYIHADISVHGGLTYAGESQHLNEEQYPTTMTNKVYWFGFDAAHSGDAVDWEAGQELIETEEEKIRVEQVKKIINKYPSDSETIKTAEYMEVECENLAEQLVKINLERRK